MAATAVAEVVKTNRRASAADQPKQTSRVRTKRRMKAKVSKLSWAVLFFVVLMTPFLYTNIYANLKKTGYSRSDFEDRYQAAMIDNQRLKVQVAIYSGPGRVKAAAVHMGLVPATNYDYLDRPQTVAQR